MPDDLKKRGPRDRNRINLSQPYEVRYWCDVFGCTKKQLSDAVDAVGTYRTDVEKFLNGT